MARIKKVLVANRGEIAIRVMRTCKELGLETVAVFSEADRSALHTRYADQAVCVGPPPSRESYLVQQNILDAARRTGADAIHPGYGFLSENASFVRACEKAGLTFIGPPASAMDAMGEKTRARANMVKAGVPVVPGTQAPFETVEEARSFAKQIGYPVMLKAAGGGGGKGMRRVDKEADIDSAWRAARSEAMSAFGNDSVYLEKFLDEPHHIEIQIFGDSHGNVVHLNERECSAQRRNQKVVEETPSPIVSPQMRAAMGEVAVKAAKSVGYVGAGTVEFLVDAKRNFYFLEMNTRLQVEHPVTEWITGIDLVAWQIHVAQGGMLPFLEPIAPRGHSIEVRVYAEDPATNFMPSRRIQYLRVPSGPFVRDDSGVYAGYTVPNVYDPMISKLSVWAPSRPEAIFRVRRALDEYVVKGITTNIRYLKQIVEHPEFQKGNYDTGFLGREHQKLLGEDQPELSKAAMIAAAVHAHQVAEKQQAQVAQLSAGSGLGRFGLALRRATPEQLEAELTAMARKTTYFAKNLGQKDAPSIALDVEALGAGRYAVTMDGHRYELDSLVLSHGAVSMLVEDDSYNVDFEERGDEMAVLVRGQVMRFDIADERKLRMRAAAATFQAEGKQTLTAPMPGKIVKIFVKVGDEVVEGQGLVVVEAMKMENELKAPKSGKVTEVFAKEGSAVENGAKLLVVE